MPGVRCSKARLRDDITCLTVPKHSHEIRDPIHVFVRLDSTERDVLNSAPFQRLRHIHQLALTYLVYPGATHRRFEHSLGVMELASRIFDVVTNPANISEEISNRLDEISQPAKLQYWRRVLRMAALCHDMGHLPFSHAAEKELLPNGWDHERITRSIIDSEEMRSIWNGMTPPLRSADVIKLAIGPTKTDDLEFSEWEAILGEIIVGDAFGADRMDYLDTLRILPAKDIAGEEQVGTPALGLQEGGQQSAEALLFARYFMYSQVYFHPVRRIYDIHLMEFLKESLDGGTFATDPVDHLRLTDNEVTAAFVEAAGNKNARGHIHASRIVQRRHFRRVYGRNPVDLERNLEPGRAIYQSVVRRVGGGERETRSPATGRGVAGFSDIAS